MIHADDIRSFQDPAWIAREGAIPDSETSDGWVFPDGTRSAICTNWAIYARRVYRDRVKLYGFDCSENPDASGMAEISDGHDFAVLDDRWILDGWLAHVEGLTGDPMIDIEDPENRAFLRSFYGDPARWVRLGEIEARVDGEEGAFREKAMEGVAPARSGAEPAGSPSP